MTGILQVHARRGRGFYTVAATLVVVLLAAAPTLSQGFTYEATQTLDPHKGKDQTQWRVRGSVEGSSAKIEFTDSNSPIFPQGSYLLTTDGGETMLLVNPKEKTYSEWDLEALFASFGALMESLGGIVDLDFEDLETEDLLSEPGPALLGYPTTHRRYRTAYSMRMKTFGIKRSWNVDTTTDVWTTDAIDAEGMFVWLRSAPPSTGNEEFDRMIREEMERASGVALKMESLSTTTDKKGREQVSRTLMEVGSLTEQDVPDATFQIPSDYRQVEPAEDPSNPAGLGSIFGRDDDG